MICGWFKRAVIRLSLTAAASDTLHSRALQGREAQLCARSRRTLRHEGISVLFF